MLVACVFLIHAATAIVVGHPESSGRGEAYDVERASATAREKAQELPDGVCSVIVWKADIVTISAGVFVCARDGIGYVVTAAHIFRDAGDGIALSFRPNNSIGEQIPVSRLHRHPQFMAGAFGGNDIAILEFKLSDLDRSMTPVLLDTSKRDDSGSFSEGWIAGYGAFATNMSKDVLLLALLHAGKTWVKIQERPGQPSVFVAPHLQWTSILTRSVMMLLSPLT